LNSVATIVTTLETSRAKPILKWAGGKSSLLSQLSPYFPQTFNKYFEPFLGGGAVFFALEITGESFLSDSNRELISLYKTVRDTPLQLMQELDSLIINYSEDFYYKLRETQPKDNIGQAARTIFLNKTGFNGLYRQNLKGGFNVPFGKRVKCPALYDKNNFLRVSTALKSAILDSSDFEALIDQASYGDFVYCDPPYEPLSNTSSFTAYQGGGFSQREQERLKSACIRAHNRGANVVISNSSADFIKELYSDCETHLVLAKRAINSKGQGRGEIEEVLITLRKKKTARTASG
jgi:DNA adenine methylase